MFEYVDLVILCSGFTTIIIALGNFGKLGSWFDDRLHSNIKKSCSEQKCFINILFNQKDLFIEHYEEHLKKYGECRTITNIVKERGWL